MIKFIKIATWREYRKFVSEGLKRNHFSQIQVYSRQIFKHFSIFSRTKELGWNNFIPSLRVLWSFFARGIVDVTVLRHPVYTQVYTNQVDYRGSSAVFNRAHWVSVILSSILFNFVQRLWLAYYLVTVLREQ